MLKYMKKRKLPLITVLLIILNCLVSKTLSNDELFQKDINLTNSYKLSIQEEENDFVSLTLYQSNKIIKGLIIGDAGIKNELIQKVELDGDYDKEYFISVYYKGSTFGAMKNIILWKKGIHWYMHDTPFARGFVEDVDNNGIYEIVNYYPEKDIYIFKDGLLINIDLLN